MESTTFAEDVGIDEASAEAADQSEAPQSDTKPEPKPEPKQEQAPPAPQATKEVAAPIHLDEQGVLEAKTLTDEFRIANMMIQSRAIPKQFQSPAQVIVAMQFLKQHRLPWAVAIRQTTIVNGCLTIWGDLPKALVERSGNMKSFEEFWFDDQYQRINFENKNLKAPIYGYCVRAERKDRAGVEERVFTLDDAIKAKLVDKDIWKLYFKRMIQCRGRGWLLKDVFPEVLSGIAIGEYDYDGGPESPLLGRSGDTTAADETNRDYGAQTG